MNRSETLKCAEEANQLVEEISQLVNKITNTKNHGDYAVSTATHSLEEKLVKIRVYVSELVNELAWRNEVSKRVKQEIDRAVCLIIGMIVGGILLHFMR